MTIQLKPEHLRFIEEQVRAGKFSSAEDVVETAISQLMADSELDEATLAAIDESEAQIEQGKFVLWKDAEAELRRRFLGEPGR